jgi:hypothetical protein
VRLVVQRSGSQFTPLRLEPEDADVPRLTMAGGLAFDYAQADVSDPYDVTAGGPNFIYLTPDRAVDVQLPSGDPSLWYVVGNAVGADHSLSVLGAEAALVAEVPPQEAKMFVYDGTAWRVL